jgi:FkbM family methyltransferase
LNNYKRLKKNIRLNGFRNIIPLKIALSERDGTGKLYINPCSTDHSLLTENNENFSFTQVQIRTLDKLLEELNIKKIDIIKIDTEGAEMPILRGAEKTLKNNPKAKMIVASYHYPREIEEVQSFLEKRGFKTEILYSDIIITI